MNEILALIFGIEWFLFNMYLYIQLPENFGLIGKLLLTLFTILFIITAIWIYREENKKGK